MIFSKNFSLTEACANNTGKTSASGTAGLACVFIGLLCFCVGCADYFVDQKSDIMLQSIVVISIGGGLLGYRKSQPDPMPADDPLVPEEKKDEPINS